jgi:hypothetical protein
MRSLASLIPLVSGSSADTLSIPSTTCVIKLSSDIPELGFVPISWDKEFDKSPIPDKSEPERATPTLPICAKA